MHDNPHRNQVHLIEEWYRHMAKIYDFWPIAYYPFGMIPSEYNVKLEGIYPEQEINQDWEEVRRVTNLANQEGFPMFMGYEWQGAGLDGDHNVFFLDNNQDMFHPLRYQELAKHFKEIEAIGVPHHLAYHLGDRGKNWETHDEVFSPFAEIHSSHGSSDSDLSPLPMKTHIHMGPRTGNTSYTYGLKHGKKIGSICSGDNHSSPGQFDNGIMCVLATDNSKEAIWEGLRKGRVYGSTQGRIDVDFTVNDQLMGSVLDPTPEVEVDINVVGNSAIDRIEFYRDEILQEVYTHKGTWEENTYQKPLRFKIQLEFGWGPDMRVFPDIYKKKWDIKVKTEGKLIGLEKCWNNLGQEIIKQDEANLEATLITHKASEGGKWMGLSGVRNEGFILEIESKVEDNLILEIDGNTYVYKVKDLLEVSHLEGIVDKADELIKERFGDVKDIRSDLWWHNAYKFKLHQAIPEEGYKASFQTTIKTENAKNVRVKIYQENGAIAFVSPVHFKEV